MSFVGGKILGPTDFGWPLGADAPETESHLSTGAWQKPRGKNDGRIP